MLSRRSGACSAISRPCISSGARTTAPSDEAARSPDDDVDCA
jgi:hypothetical protein